MKTYDQLTDKQKAKAFEKSVDDLLYHIVECGLRFDDELNHDTLQTRIDAAWAEAKRLQTPWFVGEIIMKTCREEIERMAQCDAEDALYAEPDETVISGVIS